MAERKAEFLDLKRLNIYILRKQHLAEDTKSGDITGIARDICGLHATSATTSYLSLFARMKDFRKERLDEELYTRKSLGKVRGVRGTVYMHPRDTIPVAHAANRRLNIPLSERFYRYMDRTEDEYELLSRRILELLAGKGMTAAEIKKELGEEKSVSRVLNLMCDYGLLIRGAPAGGWRSSVHTYHVLEEYMPDVDLKSVQEDEAREIMVRRYLAAFGPACVDDIAWWTAFRKGEVKKILERLGDALSGVRIKGIDREYMMLGSQESELDATIPPRKPVVNLLPMLDPYLMAYKERDRYLSPGYFPYIYDRSGNATNCILVGGRIVGVWDYDEKPPTLKYLLFEQVSKRALQVLEKQALRLGEFLSGGEVEYRECADMTSLAERTAGGFMTPLKGC